MVSTRGHPKTFPPPSLPASPTKSSSPRKSPTKAPASPTSDTERASPRARSPNGAAPTSTGTLTRARSTTSSSKRWSHTPTHLTLLWLSLSLPLVVWDTCFILGRPHTMAGGRWHSPLWVPYSLYERVDYMYGRPALEANNGWPGAQGLVNAFETAAYAWYLYAAWRFGVDVRAARGRTSKGAAAAVGRPLRYLLEPRRVEGAEGARMVVLLFGASLLTIGKTVLYWLTEVFNGFADIKHNNLIDLVLLWIIPNGLWLVLPTFMLVSSWKDTVRGLGMAAGVVDRKVQGKLM